MGICSQCRSTSERSVSVAEARKLGGPRDITLWHDGATSSAYSTFHPVTSTDAFAVPNSLTW